METQNKIQEYIEKKKGENAEQEQKDAMQKEETRQKQAERRDKINKAMEVAGNVVNAGASVIPHVVSFSIGAGSANLIPKLLKELRAKK